MKSRLALLLVAAATALILVGGVCGRKLYPPEFVSVPHSVYAGDTAWVRLAASGRGYGSVRYVVDWDGATDTTAPFVLSDTATVWHVWTAPDIKYVRAAVYSPDDPQCIRWAAQLPVVVEAGGENAPVIDTAALAQMIGVKDAPTFLIVKAHDPDGDSLRVKFDWGTAETLTVYFASPCSVTVCHVFTQVETAVVVISAQDIRGAVSLPDSILVPVGTAGLVKWYWWSEKGGCFTSAVVATDLDQEEVVMTSCCDHTFVSLRTSGGKMKSATTRYPGYAFTGHPGYNAALGHVIVGSDEGELYALSIDGLRRDWRFPNKSPEESLTYNEWGAPAFNGQNIYIGHDDTLGQLALIQDFGTQGNLVATYNVGADVNDAPVVDASGNVIFATNNGRLIRIDGNLSSPIWDVQVQAKGDIYGPILGSDGTIYCASDSARLHAIDPDNGAVKWTATLDAEAPRPVLGQTALFVGDLYGTVYSINPATGVTNWKETVSPDNGFSTAPIVTDSGIVYFQDEDDVLFCVNQADGTKIWSCDCPTYLPFAARNTRRSKKLGLTGYLPNPSICANGDIIVVGSDALYCVAGYPEGPLDPLAPWPKWQHDLYNSGYVGGGR